MLSKVQQDSVKTTSIITTIVSYNTIRFIHLCTNMDWVKQKIIRSDLWSLRISFGNLTSQIFFQLKNVFLSKLFLSNMWLTK